MVDQRGVEMRLDDLVDQFIEQHFKGRVGSGIAKLPEEVQEFIEDPSLDEAADVLLCVLIELRQRGYDLVQLLVVAETKMNLNLLREWEVQPDGTIHHI